MQEKINAVVETTKTLSETANQLTAAQGPPNFGATVMAFLGAGAAAVQTFLITITQPQATIIEWIKSGRYWMVLIVTAITYSFISVFVYYTFMYMGLDPNTALFVVCVLALVNAQTIVTVITEIVVNLGKGMVDRILSWIPHKKN